MDKTAIIIASLLIGAFSSVCHAQSFSMTSPDVPDGTADAQILQGIQVINPSEWPATFVFVGLGTKPCTATVVGPRAVLTAAHCVADKSQGDLIIGSNKFRLDCRRHNNAYKPPEYDVALCLSSSNIALRKNTDRFESVAKEIQVDWTGKVELQLLGFGCTSPNGSDFGVLYRGKAEVSVSPVPTSPRIETSEGSVACAGDSGGAAYLKVGDSRVIIGINSTGAGTYTQLAALTDPDTLDLVKTATQADSQGVAHSVRVCGIDETLSNCR